MQLLSFLIIQTIAAFSFPFEMMPLIGKITYRAVYAGDSMAVQTLIVLLFDTPIILAMTTRMIERFKKLIEEI